VAFLDEEESLPVPEAPGRSRRGQRPPRAPQQQLLIRRLIAVGIGVLLVILLVLAFKGCVAARKERAIKTFVTDTGRIMTESGQIGQDFFGLLSNSGGRTQLEYQAEIKSLRGSSETLYERGKNLGAPDEMKDAKNAVVLSLELRRNAMTVIADNIDVALGKENAVQAQQKIAEQMKLLIASDAVYQGVAIPEIVNVLNDQNISATTPPPAQFVPDPPAKWLDPATITDAFAQVTGTQTAAPGIHGLSLDAAKIGDTALTPGSPVTVPSSNPELALDITNGGESEETNVNVTVNIGGQTIEQTVAKIGAGQTTTVKIPISPPPPSGQQLTVDVTVAPVPGETNPDNNNATYTVTFQ
jgi:hypothetical protein